MCLSIPSKVIEISDDKLVCKVDTFGVIREANLMMMGDDEVKVGDFVLIHVGFVMNKIDEEEALKSIETYREILEAMDREERKRAILEGDSCSGGVS